jgi:glutamate--cysteine ligase
MLDGHAPPREVVYGLVLSEGLVYSIEPGGQLEIATPPHADLALVQSSLRRALQLVEDVTGTDVLFLSHGTNPMTEADFALQIPKSRYRILTRYLASEPGGRGIDMMRHAATVQPNIDVSSDRDAWKEAVHLTYSLSPMFKNLFANSFYFRGQAVADGLERQRIWSGMDASRSGVPPGILDAANPACTYAIWASQSFVFLIEGLPEHEQPKYGELRFLDWAKNGYKGRRPDLADWERHLSTLFPELRLRGFLEIRMLDAQPFEKLIPLMALVRGLLQAPEGRESLVREWSQCRDEFSANQREALFARLQRIADSGLASLGEASHGVARRALAALHPEEPRDFLGFGGASDFVRHAATMEPSRKLGPL